VDENPSGSHVTDLATGHSGTIVLNDPTDGPLMPTFSVQKIGNSLAWGSVHDAPASFLWEIGHTSPFASPQPDQYCTPNDPNTACDSYDATTRCGGPFGAGSTYCATIIKP
jgi:hypothetical protein